MFAGSCYQSSFVNFSEVTPCLGKSRLIQSRTEGRGDEKAAVLHARS